jgi:circadian clock protein KaiB
MSAQSYGQVDGLPATVSRPFFRIYVAGEAPNSILAQRNLKALCERRYGANYSLEVVDVLLSPERAWTEGVIATPMTVRIAPAPEVRIIGNLSDTRQFLRGLGLAIEPDD